MLRAFRDRLPWAAVVVSLVTGPVFGMLYLNRGRYALIYAAALIGGRWLWSDLISDPILNYFGSLAIGVLIDLAGGVHAYFIAHNRVPEESLRWYSRWFVVVPAAIVVLTTIFLGQGRTMRSFYIPSRAMEPTLAVDDRFLVDTAAYHHSSPKRGDVIAFHVSHDWHTIFAKRVVGLPGERIQFVNDIEYVNGVAVQLRDVGPASRGCDAEDCAEIHVYMEYLPNANPHEIFRSSRTNVTANTPTMKVPTDCFYVAGDNRDNSMDTRFEDFGCVPLNAIVGRAVVKYFDGHKRRIVWEAIN
jgi:signal peptidase I